MPTLDERQAERFRVFSLYVTKIATADDTPEDLILWADERALPAFAEHCREAALKLKAVAAAIARADHASRTA